MAYNIDLSGQVAIVTGGESGIGNAVATKLAAAGAKIAVCGITPVEKARPAIDKLKDLGTEAIFKNVDLAVRGNGKKFVQDVIGQFGRVDIVINCAGIEQPDWDRVFNVNVISIFDIIEEAAKDMKKRKYGRIVNITTSATFSGGTASPYYNASKGASDSLTRFMAKRYAPDGILINAVAPGPVLTALLLTRYTEKEYAEHYINQMPIGRYLVPEDIAGPVFFLSTGLCSSLCGETLLCDGGRVKLSVR